MNTRIEKAQSLGPIHSMGDHHGIAAQVVRRKPWSKGKIVGKKVPFKPKDIWALRVRLQMEGPVHKLALLNFGIGSKLCGCDLAIKVRDVCRGDQVACVQSS